VGKVGQRRCMETGEEGKGLGKGRLPLPQLETLDPAMEKGMEGRRGRMGGWVGASGLQTLNSFFHCKH